MPQRAPKQADPIRPEEQALLQAIVDHPHDTARWLILADWLEEHDDPRRAELLRLHRQLIATCCEPEQHPERAGQQAHLVQLLTEGIQPSVPRQTLALANGVEMTFAWIPPGRFLMGSPEKEVGRRDDEAQHLVTLAQGYWLAVTPVTQTQWQALMGDNPSHFRGRNRPVESVDWKDCQAFCLRLAEREDKSIRLPTEAEWEYACRAGTSTPFFFGQALSAELANFDGRGPDGQGGKEAWRKHTTPAALFPCNAWGLVDMHGNVYEWCQDGYRAYTREPVQDPAGPKRGNDRVLRGGCWLDDATCCRASARSKVRQSIRAKGIGFRPAFGLR